MTEADAFAAIEAMNVPRETLIKLQEFAGLVLAENQSQNLIARSTESRIWERHMLDSAQLLTIAGDQTRCSLDVGSGAGFPGMVLAILSGSEHVLVEPRRRRADFLTRVADALELTNVRVVQSTVETLTRSPVGTITARAVASLGTLLLSTQHLADASTTWLLHRGRNASFEVDEIRPVWNAQFDLIPSLTDPSASIVRVRELAEVSAR